jgi:C1A family cysteine protease
VNWEPLASDSATHHWELTQAHPLPLGIRVFPSFKSDESARTGLIVMPRDDEVCIGGHALLAIGHDPPQDLYECLNWWMIDGVPWGDGGRAWIPGAYIRNPLLCGEIHAGRAVRVL